MAISNQINKPLFYTLGKTQKIETPLKAAAEQNISIQKSDNVKLEIIPEQYRSEQSTDLILNNEFTLAGNYNVIYNKQTEQGIALNYNRSESILSYFKEEDLKNYGTMFRNFKTFEGGQANIGYSVADFSEGIKYWKTCIILALCFLLAEILLIRFLK